ncbi:Protein of uncharacterised function (DUF1018) [Campylobacter hyointestinalis]|uniref:Protein of uncharacterized function (DUF1018) n=1 Tax=Campylobacter hyointestinalis subsp. hyointestinalis TaxID=91352 RepID=A0A0S4SR53_CAMHY|nr:phage protein GemA/Gp16 family protein [Campylobacter hyointestinalis]CUU88084.1 Protein of uncharacterised function (DUF1018) [Campylobacter hyointestinalis subsp. hyointestinalis]CUU88926.1 Protein of uncharacterised function (DUF1018) [Campylobacter hyointestinalis]
MTSNQEIYRKQLIARIHLNSQYQQIKAYDAWSEWLEARFGVRSCKELSIGELKMALNILLGNTEDKTGLKPDWAGRNLVKNASNNKTHTPKMASGSQVNYIHELADRLGLDELGLMKFCMKQTKILFSKQEQLYKISSANATKIIIGLERIVKFKEKK